MQRAHFFGAFANLLRRWHVYQDATREPEQVVELAMARSDLDDARRTVAEARVAWDSSSRGPNPPGSRTSVSDDDLARLRVQVYPS